MLKTLRITILLFILFMVAMGTWLTQLRSTDWNNSLWVKIYPINGDGSNASGDYIAGLGVDAFAGIEEFLAREVRRYGHAIERPVRIELGQPVNEQPPAVDENGSMLDIALWSLRMRWWVSGVAGDQDRIDPDVRIFVRYHSPERTFALENSVGLQKGILQPQAPGKEQRRHRPRIPAYARRHGQIRSRHRHAAGAARVCGTRPVAALPADESRTHGRPYSGLRRHGEGAAEPAPRRHRPADGTGNPPLGIGAIALPLPRPLG